MLTGGYLDNVRAVRVSAILAAQNSLQFIHEAGDAFLSANFLSRNAAECFQVLLFLFFCDEEEIDSVQQVRVFKLQRQQTHFLPASFIIKVLATDFCL